MVPNFIELIFHWKRQIISKDLSLNQEMMNKLTQGECPNLISPQQELLLLFLYAQSCPTL